MNLWWILWYELAGLVATIIAATLMVLLGVKYSYNGMADVDVALERYKDAYKQPLWADILGVTLWVVAWPISLPYKSVLVATQFNIQINILNREKEEWDGE